MKIKDTYGLGTESQEPNEMLSEKRGIQYFLKSSY
jgi:hypothetical protein